MSATPNMTQAALAMIRDTANGPAELASYFGQSQDWAAGLIHAVTGDDDFAFAEQMADCHPTRAEMEDYQSGFRHGLDLMERDALADGWNECCTIAAAEAAQAAEPLPLPADDTPW